MIIVDKYLEQRARKGKPIRVGLIGAGFMGRAIGRQLLSVVRGIDLVAVASRNLANAYAVFHQSGIRSVRNARTVDEVSQAIALRQSVVTTDPLALCQAQRIDAIVEVTGNVEVGARVSIDAIRNRKHVILMNAELGATLGPILKVRADEAGVVFTDSDGDQPGVIMNLFRFVKGLGITPVLCGNIKGLHDPYRNPTTQQAFAEQWKQQPSMVTSFADGTKVSFEMALVANATGMAVGKRGMFGPQVPAGTPIQEAVRQFPGLDQLKGSGIVDYIVGAAPAPGVFVIGLLEDAEQQHYLNYYKLGEGPLYCFYTPYHLCHLEVPNTIARAVLFKDAAIAPHGKPTVDVVATAKRDLFAGEVLDGIGCYMTYGQCENADVTREGELLPMGLAAGCRLIRDIPKDQVLTYKDVELPDNRLCDQLRRAQDEFFLPFQITIAPEPSFTY